MDWETTSISNLPPSVLASADALSSDSPRFIRLTRGSLLLNQTQPERSEPSIRQKAQNRNPSDIDVIEHKRVHQAAICKSCVRGPDSASALPRSSVLEFHSPAPRCSAGTPQNPVLKK